MEKIIWKNVRWNLLMIILGILGILLALGILYLPIGLEMPSGSLAGFVLIGVFITFMSMATMLYLKPTTRRK
jgi:hypothetical protein